MCLALVMGNMIGSGIFLLPVALAPYGWNAVGGWIFTIAGVMAIAAVLARLARARPEADGPYGYVQAAFGDLPAFLISYSYWNANWIGNAAIVTGAVSYLSVLTPGLTAIPGATTAMAVALIWLITLISLRGARSAGGFQVITTAIKLIPLLLVITLAALLTGSTRGAALLPFSPADLSIPAISAAAALSLWALVGFESATLATATIESPSTTVPRATLLGVSLTGLLYLIACSGIVLLMPVAVLTASSAPFADFVGRSWGTGIALFIVLCAAISALGALNSSTLIQGVIPASLVRAGTLPPGFAAPNAAGAPAGSLIASGLLTTALVLLNGSKTMGEAFAFTALLATSVTLFLYLGVAAAALKLRVGGVLAACAVLFALWTLQGAGLVASGWSLVLLLTGVPVFWFVQWRLRRSITFDPGSRLP